MDWDRHDTAPSLLIVDGDTWARRMLRERFMDDGYFAEEAGSAAETLRRVDAAVDLVLTDLQLIDGNGFPPLGRITELAPEPLVILMTASSMMVGTAVNATGLVAHNVLTKPVDPDGATVTAGDVRTAGRLRRQVRLLRAGEELKYGFNTIIGSSPVMRETKSLLARVASSPTSTVLLAGETGTGKDLAARVIHFNSSRATKPFVNINCSMLPDQLLERELFGHDPGAFTDAQTRKRGLFEAADGGTVYLNEISEMTAVLQAKLLCFLEEKTFTRVGGIKDIHVDVRVIAATNQNLWRAVEDGRFREDLFCRLQVVPMPPLRERTGDVTLLVDDFIAHYNVEFRKRVLGSKPRAVAILARYDWPGNIRELRNVIERIMLLLDGPWIRPEDVPVLGPTRSTPFRLPPEGVNLLALERDLLVQALERAGGNQTLAGQLLGINRGQVRYRLEKFELPGDASPHPRGTTA